MPFPPALLKPIIAEVEEALNPDTDQFYRAGVEGLNRLFGVTADDEKFRSDLLPTYFSGNIDAPPRSRFLLFSLNPGYESGVRKIRGVMKTGKSFERDFLEPARSLNLSTYLSVSRTFYERAIHLQRGKQTLLPFYETFYAFLHGLAAPDTAYADHTLLPAERMLYLQRNLIALDLIPYHAAHFVPPATLSGPQVARIRAFWRDAEDRIVAIQPRLIIVNARVLDVLGAARIADVTPQGAGYLVPHAAPPADETTPRTPRDVRLWVFRLAGIPAITFDHFITGRYGGFTDSELHDSVAPFVAETAAKTGLAF